MRFNTSYIMLGLAAAASAVPVSVPSGISSTSQPQSDSVAPNLANGGTAINGSSPTSNMTTREFDLEAAQLNRREYAVEITFKREGGVHPTEETEAEAEKMVKATMVNAAKKLKMGEGSELTITFTNKWPSAFLEKVDFTFQDPVCGSGGTGTCDGESKPGGKGTIKGGAKKRKDARVLWTQAVCFVFFWS
ncbi:hypothetical protein EV361DRAFT_947511 [Lentinula raphanica]|nr:hypothetical protein EV361DRAFT_947511 [Lentinula raphanica]